MLKKLAAISLVAGALVIAAPAAASATEDGSYADRPKVSVDDPTVDVCSVSTIVFGPDYFAAGETVGVSVSGFDAGNAQISGNTADTDGSMVVSFRPPSDGADAYAITFDGAERSYTAAITVREGRDAASSCDHDPGAVPGNMELPLSGSNDMELALTGGSASPWILGGGVLALAAGGSLVVAGAMRRRRA